MKQVAVTGASGFIGQRLCRHLLSQGIAVRILIRDASRAANLGLVGAQLVDGSLTHYDSLKALVQGVDAIVHAAGAVRGNSEAPFLAVNSGGTANLLRAVAEVTPDAHLLLISSLAAREPDLSWYAHSKREAERLLEASSLRYTILRPPAVYGPGDAEMRAIFDSMARGFAPVPGLTEARTSLIHVDDLVTAIEACLRTQSTIGQRYELGDGHPSGYSWQDLADIAANVFSRRVHLLVIPTWLLNSIAAVNLAFSRLLRRPAMLTPPKLRELRHSDWSTSNTQITAATGWQPAVGLESGLSALYQTAQ